MAPDWMQGKQLKSEHSQPIEQISASLGQVYKAHLTHSGQIVDAEVQQRLGTKGIPDRLLISRCNALVPKKLLDLTFTGFFINKYIDFIASNVVALIDEFSSRVYQELNYVQYSSARGLGRRSLNRRAEGKPGIGDFFCPPRVAAVL
ncbi:hypothetical protein POTOM_049908 [Populus tomentosa]|uniref:Uncharacterized protein n=1 Tax=Populus tomentosa TaxID=118781 RepID=A0A8X8CC84_POPTO|nr:hypothetical protein POTOM_049908 [Populus tomentosa]